MLEPALQEVSLDSIAQKAKYGGELYAVKMRDVGRYFTYLELFQRDRDGYPKGIIALNLKELTDG